MHDGAYHNLHSSVCTDAGHTYEIMALNKTPEFSLRLEVIIFLENQNIWYILLRLVMTAVKCIAYVVGNSIR